VASANFQNCSNSHLPLSFFALPYQTGETLTAPCFDGELSSRIFRSCGSSELSIMSLLSSRRVAPTELGLRTAPLCLQLSSLELPYCIVSLSLFPRHSSHFPPIIEFQKLAAIGKNAPPVPDRTAFFDEGSIFTFLFLPLFVFSSSPQKDARFGLSSPYLIFCLSLPAVTFSIILCPFLLFCMDSYVSTCLGNHSETVLLAGLVLLTSSVLPCCRFSLLPSLLRHPSFSRVFLLIFLIGSR